MNRNNKFYLPRMNKTITRRGRGIGSVILDGGMGGQSSYESIDDYVNTANVSPSISSYGSGLKGLEKIRNKMENLVIKPSSRKIKNIKFSL